MIAVSLPSKVGGWITFQCVFDLTNSVSLGFTHTGGTTRRGKCTVRRCTIAKLLCTTLQEVKQTLRERRHWPIKQFGEWLLRVVVGHYRYYGVPRTMGRRRVFRECIRRYWCRIFRRRSQRHRMTWQWMSRLATPWLPASHIMHPYPAQRLRVTTRCGSAARRDLGGAW